MAADSPPAKWSVGAEENCGSSWPTHCQGVSTIRPASAAISAANGAGSCDSVPEAAIGETLCERCLSKMPGYVPGHRPETALKKLPPKPAGHA